MEKVGFQFGVLVEWNMEVFGLGYRSKGKGRSSVRCKCRMEQGDLLYGYRSIATFRSSLWITGRMDQEDLLCRLPFQRNREFPSFGLPLEWKCEHCNVG